MPAAIASSTAYWISGLSTIGSISFGLALVAGRKRVPRPATGKTAFVTFSMCVPCVLWFGMRAGAGGSARMQRQSGRQTRQLCRQLANRGLVFCQPFLLLLNDRRRCFCNKTLVLQLGVTFRNFCAQSRNLF